MIAGQPHHNWPSLVEVIERCEQRGCVKRQVSGEVVTDEGAFKIYYLLNTVTRNFFVISDYEDNERMPPSFRASLERRLGIDLGFPF